MRVGDIIRIRMSFWRYTKRHGIYWAKKKFGSGAAFLIVKTKLEKPTLSYGKLQYRWTVVCPDGTLGYIEKNQRKCFEEVVLPKEIPDEVA